MLRPVTRLSSSTASTAAREARSSRSALPRVIVEGVNIVTKHVKPRKMGEAGGLIKAESALYADKVQLVCPKCGRPTRTGSKINAKGKKVRTCKKSDCLAEFE